jgi:Amt family ammonium transporter
LIATPAFAEDVLDTGDTAWMIVSTALVMMMTPAGLALFYGGMSRYKNLLNTLAMTFVSYCLASVIWMMWGYTLAFGSSQGGIIGGFEHFFMSGIGVDSLSGSIPTYVFALFQMTFAGITVALVLGSIVDRMKFSSWIVFTILWVTFIYCPIAHWVWGGGWMGAMGALDFAGGNVVHINAGVAGLVLSLVLGKRVGYGKEAMFPSSIALTALGAALLWFGWFGFNAGSQLAADGVAASAFLVTNTSAATAALVWMFCEWIVTGKPTVLGIASGVVAGLVAITPAAGFVNLPGVTDHRPGFRGPGLLFRCRGQTQNRLRRFAGRLWCPWYVRHLGCPGHRPFRQSRHHRRRHRPVLRQPRAAVDPGRLHCCHRSIYRCGDD